MSGCSSPCGAERCGLSFALSSRVLLALAGPLSSCVPERGLSSYAGGTDAPPSSGSAVTSSAPGTGGISSFDAGDARFDAAAAADASETATLVCRGECSCERRGARDFMFCGTLVNHEEAAARCGAAGGTLASVDEASHNAWLTERMQTLAQDDFWLSGTDAEDEGVWRWVDGRVFYDEAGDAARPSAFAPWEPEQPNNLNGEDCMRSIAGTWRDLDCSELIAYVCQG
jgi:hypothetical protein